MTDKTHTIATQTDADARLAKLSARIVAAPSGRDTADLLLASHAWLFAAGGSGSISVSTGDSSSSISTDDSRSNSTDDSSSSASSSGGGSASSSASGSTSNLSNPPPAPAAAATAADTDQTKGRPQQPAVVIASNDRRFASALRHLRSRGVAAVLIATPEVNPYVPGLGPNWGRHQLGKEADAVAGWQGVGSGGGNDAARAASSAFGDGVWVRLRGGCG